MRNLLLTLCFDGTAYHGWQVQKNAVTVQQTLQDSLQTVLKERPAVSGCSRTDSGVHANAYSCNFRTEHSIPCESLKRALNAALPRDIRVSGCREAPPDFHARYSAAWKEYVYKIDNGEVANPFLNRYALFYPHTLDCGLLGQAARAFCGTHDFHAFCAAGSSVKDTVRTVRNFGAERRGSLVLLTVEADGFLYNMVRIMVGTLLYVAQGKLTAGDIPAILAGRSRSMAGPTAPPHGLYLNRVFYEKSGSALFPREENG